MSQKTNPLSLRLQKTNQNFSCPWFSDFFFTENYHYGFSFENYISTFLRETQYSKALLSSRISYGKFSIWVWIQDTRAEKKSRRLSFLKTSGTGLSSRISAKHLKSQTDSALVIRELFQKRKAFFTGHRYWSSWVEKNFYVLSKLQRFASLNISPSECKKFRLGLQKTYGDNPIKKNRDSFLYLPSSMRLNIDRRMLFPFEVKGEASTLSKAMANQRRISVKTSFDEDTQTNSITSFLRSPIRNNFLRKKQGYTCYSPLDIKAFQDVTNLKKGCSSTSKNLDQSLRKTDNKTGQISTLKKSNAVQPFTQTLVLKNDKSSLLSYFKEKKQTQSIFNINKTINKTERQGDNLPLLNVRSQGWARPTSLMNTDLLSFFKKSNLSNDCSSTNEPAFLKNNTFPVILDFQPIRFIRSRQNVISLLDQIVMLLEKRIAWRPIQLRLFKEISRDSQIKGVRITCSGRLGGRSKKAQKAKMISNTWGETSLNVFSSKLLWGSKSANTSYGKVGIKLWICFEDNSF